MKTEDHACKETFKKPDCRLEDGCCMLRRLISLWWSMSYDEAGNRTGVEWSDEFRRMLGFQNETDVPDMLEAWAERLYPEDRAAAYDLIDQVVFDRTGDALYDVEYRLKTKDGGLRWFHATGDVMRRQDGSPSRFFCILFDITDQKESAQALEDALLAAQHANKAKTVFLNNMSHDIRTPMNAIIGFTSLAAAHVDNPELVKDYLAKITTSGNHLLSLINDVLDMSRIESGKIKIEEKEASLPEIMHDLKTIVQSDIYAKQLEFYIDTMDVVDENIICDRLRLNQVLLNILSNAMKFTKPGGMVSVRVIQRGGAPAGYASYEFRVKDTGIGMSKEFLEHIYEPFEREQNRTAGSIQGTGLGMAITKNIVNMMNGTIDVQSEEGKGTEFIVSLQFRVSGNPVTYEPIPELQGMRALVVDDDYNICASVTKMLGSIGMRSDWTTSGKEAVLRTQLAMEQNDEFHAYIVDLLMPDMNGVETVRRIRHIIGNSKPIIVLTAYDWSDIEDDAREAGVTAFCSKPLFLSELRETLSRPFVIREGSPESGSKPDFVGKHILLAEDNELNQEIAVSILEEAGFVVDVADDGEIAVGRIAETEAGTYDLILMDIQMPHMNGYEATRAIRSMEDQKKAGIPIIAMTANAFEEDKRSVLEAGMNGYTAKPIDIEKLFDTLAAILT